MRESERMGVRYGRRAMLAFPQESCEYLKIGELPVARRRGSPRLGPAQVRRKQPWPSPCSSLTCLWPCTSHTQVAELPADAIVTVLASRAPSLAQGPSTVTVTAKRCTSGPTGNSESLCLSRDCLFLLG